MFLYVLSTEAVGSFVSTESGEFIYFLNKEKTEDVNLLGPKWTIE